MNHVALLVFPKRNQGGGHRSREEMRRMYLKDRQRWKKEREKIVKSIEG